MLKNNTISFRFIELNNFYKFNIFVFLKNSNNIEYTNTPHIKYIRINKLLSLFYTNTQLNNKLHVLYNYKIKKHMRIVKYTLHYNNTIFNTHRNFSNTDVRINNIFNKKSNKVIFFKKNAILRFKLNYLFNNSFKYNLKYLMKVKFFNFIVNFKKPNINKFENFFIYSFKKYYNPLYEVNIYLNKYLFKLKLITQKKVYNKEKKILETFLTIIKNPFNKVFYKKIHFFKLKFIVNIFINLKNFIKYNYKIDQSFFKKKRKLDVILYHCLKNLRIVKKKFRNLYKSVFKVCKGLKYLLRYKYMVKKPIKSDFRLFNYKKYDKVFLNENLNEKLKLKSNFYTLKVQNFKKFQLVKYKKQLYNFFKRPYIYSKYHHVGELDVVKLIHTNKKLYNILLLFFKKYKTITTTNEFVFQLFLKTLHNNGVKDVLLNYNKSHKLIKLFQNYHYNWIYLQIKKFENTNGLNFINNKTPFQYFITTINRQQLFKYITKQVVFFKKTLNIVGYKPLIACLLNDLNANNFKFIFFKTLKINFKNLKHEQFKKNKNFLINKFVNLKFPYKTNFDFEYYNTNNSNFFNKFKFFSNNSYIFKLFQTNVLKLTFKNKYKFSWNYYNVYFLLLFKKMNKNFDKINTNYNLFVNKNINYNILKLTNLFNIFLFNKKHSLINKKYTFDYSTIFNIQFKYFLTKDFSIILNYNTNIYAYSTHFYIFNFKMFYLTAYINIISFNKYNFFLTNLTNFKLFLFKKKILNNYWILMFHLNKLFFSFKNNEIAATGLFIKKKFRLNDFFKYSKNKIRTFKVNIIKCSYFNIFFNHEFYKNKFHTQVLSMRQLLFIRKKTNYVKKHFKYNKFLLKKLYFLQKLFDKKHFLKSHTFQWKTINKKFSKTYLGAKKQFHYWKDSRNFFKEFSKWKTKKAKDLRHWQFARPVRKQSRKDLKTFLYVNNNNLLNIVLKCKIAFIHFDALTLIESGLIKVNFHIVRDPELVIHKGDIIQFPISPLYYSNTWKYEKFSYAKLNHLGYRLWKIHRLRNDLYKMQYDTAPELYPLRNMYFNLPDNMEFDFKTMTLIIVKDLYLSYTINYFDIKFINIACIELYNWKYVV